MSPGEWIETMGSTRLSTIVFAVVLVGWGVVGLVKGDFAAGWQPVPESMPARVALAYLCACICIATGIGLLWERTAAIAARILFAWLVLWLLLLRVPWVIVSPTINVWWPAACTAVITGTVWVLCISLAKDRRGFFTGSKGMCIARALFGVGLIPFGIAHFLYPEATAPLVPSWLQWPTFWAYFTGVTFIAAGVAIIARVLARLAAVLITLQIGLFTLIIWVPMSVAGTLTPFQWGEFLVSIVLTACGWVVADSYRDDRQDASK